MLKSFFSQEYIEAAIEVLKKISVGDIDETIEELVSLKKRGGRLFLLGVGGSAGNCSHAVNDFRKITGIETYTPVDNVSELTARTNDDGWDTIFTEWLKGSKLSKNDAIMVFSVGGGNKEKNVSTNIVSALDYSKKIGATILGIVSRDGGQTKKVADVCILVPIVQDKMITPFAESFQVLLWHCFVNYPGLKI